MDYTLWPYYSDIDVKPPINKIKTKNQEQVVDSENFRVAGFKDVPVILKTLREHCLDENQHLAVASHSTTHDLCIESMELLGWKDYFSSFQIYSTSTKILHMKAIRDELKFENFEEVLFFDDDDFNIKTTASIGVFGQKVKQNTGVTISLLIEALHKFSSNTINL